MTTRLVSLAALACALPLAATAQTEGMQGGGDTVEPIEARAAMTNRANRSAGTVTFTQTPNGVLVMADLRALPPGAHGFHLHETGDCGNGFDDAGGHYAPRGNEHGFETEDGPHAGDLPNVHLVADGSGKAEFLTDRVSLEEGAEATLFDEDGSAVIVHANADGYVPGETGGGRIACGVIERVE
jgi:Cu-Zn family superoxide dismutase